MGKRRKKAFPALGAKSIKIAGPMDRHLQSVQAEQSEQDLSVESVSTVSDFSLIVPGSALPSQEVWSLSVLPPWRWSTSGRTLHWQTGSCFFVA